MIWKDENGFYHADEGEWLCQKCRWRGGKDVLDYHCKHPNKGEPVDYPFIVACKNYEEKTKDMELYEQAVAKWGIHAQILMAVEEMSELIKVLVKYGRNVNSSSLDEIIEEIVDTEIMLEQLKLIFVYSSPTNYDKYKELRKKKLERLEKLLQEALA